jgi:cobalt-zinc-cadmium efflux system outer membrane protein
VPELTLGIGHKTVDDDLGSDSGQMIGAGITIPLFDRGQASQQRASASAAVARNEHLLKLARAGGEVRGLWNEVTDLTGAAWQQHTAASQETTALVKVAEAAYRGGEIGVLELLDAYRAAHDAELKALDMAAAARQAQVELDRLTGGLVR